MNKWISGEDGRLPNDINRISPFTPTLAPNMSSLCFRFYHEIISLQQSSEGVFFFAFIYLFIHSFIHSFIQRGGKGQREEERESQAGFALPAQSTEQGSNSQTVGSWPEPESRVKCLTDWATQVPQGMYSLKQASLGGLPVSFNSLCKYADAGILGKSFPTVCQSIIF